MANVKAFVEEGGTVIAIGSVSMAMAQQFGIPVTNHLVENGNPLPREKYFAPGCVLELAVDNKNPLAHGLENKIDVFFDSVCRLWRLPAVGVLLTGMGRDGAQGLQALRANPPTWRWFLDNARRELVTGLMLGFGCGMSVLLIAWLWRGHLPAASVIGGSIAGGVVIAAAAGLAVPSLLRTLKLDPKIAAGPLTLAIADLGAVLLYFSLATWLL